MKCTFKGVFESFSGSPEVEAGRYWESESWVQGEPPAAGGREIAAGLARCRDAGRPMTPDSLEARALTGRGSQARSGSGLIDFPDWSLYPPIGFSVPDPAGISKTFAQRHGLSRRRCDIMQYYCAHCNRLEKIESFSGGDEMVCVQCGRPLTALKEVAKSASSAPRRLGLTLLIGVTGYLLFVLWGWGGNQAAELEGWLELLVPFLSIIEIGLKIGVSIVIVSLALLIGAMTAPSRHRVPGNTAGVKQDLPSGANRNGLAIFSGIGMTLGAMIIVFIAVGVIWLVWKLVGMIFNLPLFISLLVL